MKSLTKGKPVKVILLFAVPLYIGQLFQLGYSLIDTRIIGSTLGETSLAAVGATISLSDMLIEFLNGIICGFGIIIATFFGAEDEKGLRKAIGGSLVLGAEEYGRIRKGIRDTVLLAFVWCGVALLIVFTLSPYIIRGITASEEMEIIDTAVLYLKINAVFYFLPAVICILRNSMQGFGDTKTPLVSSLIELAGKVLIAWLLAPVIGYMGVIISEPVVWIFMVIPLLIGIARNLVLKAGKGQ